MTTPTVTDFENAKQDLDDLAQIVNSTDSAEITTRLGNVIPNLTKFFSDLESSVRSDSGLVLSEMTEQITTSNELLLTNMTEQSNTVSAMHSEVLTATESATTAATEAERLVELLSSDTALAETLLQPSIASMGSLILKNAAHTHKIKITGVNAL